MNVRSKDLVALFIVALLFAVYGFEKFVLKPQHRQAATLQSQITTQRGTLMQVMRRYDAGHDAEVQLRQLGPSVDASRLAIPKTSNVPGLLRMLQRDAASVGVGISAITLGDGSGSSSDSGTSSTTTAASTTPASSAGVTQVPVSFTFDGGYQALNRLIRRFDALVTTNHGRIEAHGPFVGISQVSLAPGSTHLAFQLTATLYQHGPATSVLGSGASTSS